MTDTEEIRDKANTAEDEQGEEKKLEDMTQDEAKEYIHKTAQEIREKMQEATDAMKSGKGRLRLETPIQVGDRTIEELIYDFTELTGLEYTDAMDSDPNAQIAFKVTTRQALALFAKAAAKQTERVDMEDILEKLGATDAMAGVQLATLFFNASTQAGRMRLSKK